MENNEHNNTVDKTITQELKPEKLNKTQQDKTYCVAIRAYSYDFKLLDIAVNTIYNCIKDGDIQCNPPSPRPTKKVKFCIRRAPSIYKSSFEKYEYRIHSRLIQINNTNNLDKLICLSKADIPRAVNVDIQILSTQEAQEKNRKRQEIRNKILQQKKKNIKSNVENISI